MTKSTKQALEDINNGLNKIAKLQDRINIRLALLKQGATSEQIEEALKNLEILQ